VNLVYNKESNSAELYYRRREVDDADRLCALLDVEHRYYDYTYDIVHIEVSDESDFNNLRKLYEAYNHFDYIDYIKQAGLTKAEAAWRYGYISDKQLHDACRSDVDFYIILVNGGYDAKDAKDVMFTLTGSFKSYTSAITAFYGILNRST